MLFEIKTHMLIKLIFKCKILKYTQVVVVFKICNQQDCS